MNTDTYTRTYDNRSDAYTVLGRLLDLNERAEKKGLDGTVTVTTKTTEVTRTNEAGDQEPGVEVELTITTTGGFTLGDYRPVAVIDFTGADSGLVLSIDNDVEIGDDLDATRCDHCHRSIPRNKVVVVADADGNLIHVGGTCAKDFLGHSVDMLTWLTEAVQLDEDGPREPTKLPLVDVVAAAIEANRLGYRKSGEADSNKQLIHQLLFGRGRSTKDLIDAIAETPAATVTVDEVLTWMRDEAGDSDFGRNMAAIADSEYVGHKAFGFIAYAPAGATNWRARMAEQAAKRAADEARKATATPVPVTDKRITIEGEVVTAKWVDNDFGGAYKLRIVTPEGWAAWGTCPKAITPTETYDEDLNEWVPVGVKVGDKVRFVAKVERSQDDELFGFWSRPTKPEIVEVAELA